jgi:hypothetical protein
VFDFPKLRLTDRDKAILLAVSRYRFLTTSHILLLVPGSRQNITRRLQRLYHAGYLDRPRAQLPLRFAGELSEFVYSPTRKTASPIATLNRKTAWARGYKPVTSLFLAHQLLVSEALIRIELGCRLESVPFIGEDEILDTSKPETATRRLHWRVRLKTDATSEQVGVIPDAIFAVEPQGRSELNRRLYFFLEADRGTMPLYRKSLRLSSIRRKALAYSRTRRRQVLREQFGIPGFQVLFVSSSEERMHRMKEACRAVMNGRNTSLFLFVTIDELAQGITLSELLTGRNRATLG